jgi:hypothetical protein
MRTRQALEGTWRPHVLSVGWRWVDFGMRIGLGCVVLGLMFRVDKDAKDKLSSSRADLSSHRQMVDWMKTNQQKLLPDDLNNIALSYDNLIVSTGLFVDTLQQHTDERKLFLILLAALLFAMAISDMRLIFELRRLRRQFAAKGLFGDGR